MARNMDRYLVIRVLMMAVWKRQPKECVSPHRPGEPIWQRRLLAFMRKNKLEHSMSRRGNRHEGLPNEVLWAQC